MSEDAKPVTRPKIRFCQTDAGKSITKELKSSTDQNGTKQSNKPKILRNETPLNDANNIQNIKANNSNETDLKKECAKDLDILKHKARLASANNDTKKCNVTNKKSSSITTKKNLNSKPVDVMPCYKYNKVASKIKTPIVKKVMIRNIIGSKIQPNIGPGVSRSQPDNLRILKTDGNIHTKPITSGEKLAKPEYNSIIYENQLPSRLTRSKDPEPRQKDIVPVLSDFFTPESTEEYCIPVSIKPRTPETVDSWNAFRISDQINEWKHILNHE
ncbi:hypothetical protein K0M31_015496 [Melipona bicolor]|uniref:Protein phosphatase 1 regulatory subunit 35 C-terminal domain-containing protein n=1 Tax=Melipona bicolor TaxID=60889 RepID=A0AA40FFT0_9HYME|nr:hypothetical protein K0M31_015496 [Melipona bicolor]